MKKLSENDLTAVFYRRPRESQKYDFGRVTFLGGSICYSGAIRLSEEAFAALRAGCGLSRVASTRTVLQGLRSDIPEVTMFPMPEDPDGTVAFSEEKLEELQKLSDVIVFGMGFGRSESGEKILSHLLSGFSGRLLIDADGLYLLSKIGPEKLKKAKPEVLLTPHHGEFRRLYDCDPEELKDPEKRIRLAERFSSEYGAVLLLKGAETVVAGGGRTIITDRGCPGMATAGSGDVLSGIIGGIWGYTEDAVLAASAGAYLAGTAGELAAEEKGNISMTARDTIEKIPAALKKIEDLRDRKENQ